MKWYGIHVLTSLKIRKCARACIRACFWKVVWLLTIMCRGTAQFHDLTWIDERPHLVISSGSHRYDYICIRQQRIILHLWKSYNHGIDSIHIVRFPRFVSSDWEQQSDYCWLWELLDIGDSIFVRINISGRIWYAGTSYIEWLIWQESTWSRDESSHSIWGQTSVRPDVQHPCVTLEMTGWQLWIIQCPSCI